MIATPSSVITLGLAYSANLLITLGYGIGNVIPPTPPAVQQNSGGYWEPKTRRRTKKDLYAERVRLGIFKPQIEAAAKKVVETIETPSIEVYYRENKQDLQKLFLKELQVSSWLPDYSRAIEAAIRIKEEEDDEDLKLALLM